MDTESEQVTSKLTMLLHMLSSCGLIKSAKLFNRYVKKETVCSNEEFRLATSCCRTWEKQIDKNTA